METPEHDVQLDDPSEDSEEVEHEQDDLDADEAQESAGGSEAPTGP